MDPTETLKLLRRAVSRYLATEDPTDAQEIVEHFDALDAWLSQGGFPPWQWTTQRAEAEAERIRRGWADAQRIANDALNAAEAQRQGR